MRRYWLLSLALGVIVMTLGWPLPGRADSAALYVAPGSARVTVGGGLDVAVREDSGSDPVNAVQANLSYSANILQFDGIIDTGSAFDVVAQGSGGGGAIAIARGTISPVSGDNLVATISFTVIANGTASIGFTGGSQVVRSTDNAGILASSSGGTYTAAPRPAAAATVSVAPVAKAPVDTTPPTLSDIHVSNLTQTAATITWTTDKPATSEVQFGLTASYGLVAQSSALVTQHSVTLGSDYLVPRTTYHYRIQSVDDSGNTATGQDAHFDTLGYQAQIVVTGATGKPLTGASVIIGDTELTTDVAGRALFDNVAPGMRLVTLIYHSIYQSQTVKVGPSTQGRLLPVLLTVKLAAQPTAWEMALWPYWVVMALLLMLVMLTRRRQRSLSSVGHVLGGYLNLSEHRHSGKRLPHPHTSYAGVFFLLVMTGVILGSVSVNSQASGGSYSVTATVAGTAPTVASLISAPANETIISQLPANFKGTCPAGMLVRLYSGGNFLGSALCQADGTFGLGIALAGGVNIVQARTFNQAGLEGPAADGVVVRYEPAAAIANLGLSPVLITTSQTTVAAWQKQTVNWEVKVAGGQPPYALLFNWGDGTSDLVSQAQAGGAAVAHAYQTAGDYTVKVTAKDAAGQVGYLQIAGLIHVPSAATTATKLAAVPNLWIAWPLYILAVLMLISFWLGERYEKRRDDTQPTEPGPEVLLPPRPPRPASRRLGQALKVGLIIILVGAGAGGTSLALKLTASGPATGQVSQSRAASPLPTPTGPKTYSGRYLSFEYPAAYQTIPPSQNGSAYLETVDLAALPDANRSLAVTVQPGTNLATVPSVQLRQSQPALYRETSLESNGDTGLVFTKLGGGFEESAFIVHGSDLATISLTDPNTIDLSTDFTQIIDSLAWQ